MIDILLATYQGAHYLEEQVDSLFAQTYPHFHLWIRDDGSSDYTPAILQSLKRMHPKRITLLPGQKKLGITQNFSTLLQASKAPYVCFADQDDRWLPYKLADSLAKMKELESLHGGTMPLLVHTDLTVAGKDLKEIHPSFWQYAHLNPHYTGLNRLLVQNHATGCTMLMNRALVDLALPIPPQAVMHDWWIALVAASLGHMGIVKHSTLLYRQHGLNDTGAKRYGLRRLWRQSKQEEQKKKACALQTHLQAQALLDRYEALLDPDTKHLLTTYATLKQHSYFTQKRHLVKHRFFKQGFWRNVKAFINS